MITYRGFVHTLWVVLALAATPAAAGPAEEASAVIDKWLKAFNANDTDAVVKLYTQNAMLFGTSSPYLSEGTDAIRAYFSRLPRSGDKVVFSMLRMMVLDDGAVAGTGYYEFTLAAPDGKLVVSAARFTMVIVKVGNTWLIAQHHSSPRPRTQQ